MSPADEVTPRETPRGRISSLDGLRGLAALVVVAMHCMLLVPIVARAFDGRPEDYRGIVWWVTFTPLHAFWAGSEAVIVFFVLSGFVLARSAGSLTFSWRAYYPSRLLRLYLPAAGALAFALATVAIVSRKHNAHASWWLNAQTEVHTSARNLVHDLVLVKGAETLLPVLWSLKWEVIFSLLLPVAVYGVSRRPGIALLQAAILLAITLFGSDSTSSRWGGYLLFLPMFFVGALMAKRDDLLTRLGQRLSGWSGSVVVAGGVVLLTGTWSAHLETHRERQPAEVVGAALLVFAFGYWRSARTLGESRPVQWLGQRSFSLYLVHYPIVAGIAFLLGSRSRFAFALAFPAALLMADVFFRWVEAPSHRLAQRVRLKLNGEALPGREGSPGGSRAVA